MKPKRIAKQYDISLYPDEAERVEKIHQRSFSAFKSAQVNRAIFLKGLKEFEKGASQ